ncbi:Panacea domain-containing protein [Paenibacillus brasilensis]|nr:type II toxin-antitoxin system antitoxin SocA domain-containing protein [Paenibacillus brasilensis]
MYYAKGGDVQMAKIIYLEQVKTMSTTSTTFTETTVFDVAKAFLNLEPMTPKKLQKLCFYAYSWYMVFYEGDKLFDGEFEAWIHGPVNPELYREYRKYGFNEIPQEDVLPDEISNNPRLVEFLEHIHQTYGHLDGDQLEYLTHQEDPWLNARKNLKPYEPSNNVLDDDDIIEYYRGELENG